MLIYDQQGRPSNAKRRRHAEGFEVLRDPEVTRLERSAMRGRGDGGCEVTTFVEADSAIRQLHARYVDAVWRQDLAAFEDCFAADAEWKIAGLHMRGRAQIRTQFAKFVASAERVFMVLGMPCVEMGDGTTATSRIHVTELVKGKDGHAVRTIGVYYDRYVAQGDRFRFQGRHWSLYYYGLLDLSAPFFEPAEYGAAPAMPAPDAPTFARKGS